MRLTIVILCGLALIPIGPGTAAAADALILMRSSQKDLNAIIKTIPDIVFRLDASGRITFISPALAKYKKKARGADREAHYRSRHPRGCSGCGSSFCRLFQNPHVVSI
jgi:PAS domain-containing protein